MNFNTFRNLPRIKDLPAHEQSRQWWIRQGDRLMESSFVPAAAASAAAGAGGTYRPPLAAKLYGFTALFGDPEIGLRLRLLGLEEDGITPTTQDAGLPLMPGPSVFARNTDDKRLYYVTNNQDGGEVQFGVVSKEGIQEISSNISDITYGFPSQLTYMGSGQFLYLDGGLLLGLEYSGSTQSLLTTIDTSGSAAVSATVSTFYGQSVVTVGYNPADNTAVGVYWPGEGFPPGVGIAVAGTLNPETGQLEDWDLLNVAGGLPEIGAYKAITALGAHVARQAATINGKSIAPGDFLANVYFLGDEFQVSALLRHVGGLDFEFITYMEGGVALVFDVLIDKII